MNAASIVSVITVYGVVFLSLLALYVEKGERPFRRTRRGFRRLPAWEKTFLALFVGAWIAFASVKDGTNGVNQVEGDTNMVTQTEGNTNDWVNVEGTNAVGQTDGEGTNETGSAPGPLMMRSFGRPNLTSGMTPSITDEDIARMWRISSTTDVGALAAPTANAVTNADWCDYGGMSDARRIKPGGWRFPYGDKATDGLTVFQNGDFRPNVKTHFFPRPFDANLSLLPRLNWRLLPDGGESVFWHEHTPSNSLILTWNNALYNRDASCPTNFQAELFPDGRFDYRYPDRTVRYVPVFPFDWDGDGLENSVDPDPFVANPIDAHGTNDEWRQIVCSNVFESVGGMVSFRDDVNTNAYYFVDVCAEMGPAPIYFNADRDSRIGSPVVVAQGGVTNRVPLLIGVGYAVTSTVPISVAFNDIGFARVTQTDERSYAVKWPLAFHFAEGSLGQFMVSVVPYDPGVTYAWASTPSDDESGGRTPLMSAPAVSECHCWSGVGAMVRFSCSDNCGCGGDCLANGTASIESASFAVTGGVCRCSLRDDPHGEYPYSPPDPLVGGLKIKFSNKAVIFEDEYRNTEDGPLVPRRSTTTLLTISASGGTHGGSISLTTRNLVKLIAANGPGPVSPITEKILAPHETYFASFVCEGVTASGSANDVEVSGAFIEFDTGRTESSSDVVTVVQLVVSPEHLFPQSLVTRHTFGVCEMAECRIYPRDLSNMSWQFPTNVLAYDPDENIQEFQYLLDPGNATLTFTFNSVSYPILTQCVAPTAIVSTEPPELFVYDVPTNHAGGIGMRLELALCPTNVSFAGILVKELATDDGVATGYFCHPDFADWCSHTRVQGANRAITVGVANNFFDTAAMEGSCPPLSGTDGWSVGDITWTIPTVWREPSSFFMTRGYRNLSTERQVFTIDAAGTVGVEKFRRKVVRPFGGTVSWDVIQ